MAAKRTPDLIPLCHPLALTSVDGRARPATGAQSPSTITATCRITGRTGVEMEALTAVSVAALTIYDMCKAVDRGMRIGEIHLVHKSGGKSGTYEANTMISVEEARARLLAPLEAARRGARVARRGGGPRARRGCRLAPDAAALRGLGDGRLCRARRRRRARAGASCAVIGSVPAGQRLRRLRRRRRGGAHLHRRAGAGRRRRHRHPGGHRTATAKSWWSARARPRAATSARPGSISAKARSGLKAGRRLTARDIGLAAAMNRPWLLRASPAARRHPADRRRGGDAGRSRSDPTRS